MQGAESILVIILASTLTIFLLLGIVILVLLAKLLRSVKRTVEKAEEVVESAGEATQLLRDVSGPLAVFKLVRNILKHIDKNRR